MKRARGAQIRYVTRTYVWLVEEERACAKGLWAFSCADSDDEYVENSVPWWSDYILPGRWIDANDHMYMENLAIDEKQCPPYVKPLFVIRPKMNQYYITVIIQLPRMVGIA